MKHSAPYTDIHAPLRVLTRVMACGALLLALGSCSGGDAPEPPAEPDGITFDMRLEIFTNRQIQSERKKAPATRVDDEDHPQEESSDLFEDAINISQGDMALYMFDESGKCSFATTDADYDLLGSAGTGYVVNTRVKDYVIPASDSEDTSFTIVVLANLKGAGGTYPAPAVNTTTLTDFNNTVSNLTFTLAENNSVSWYPGTTVSNATEAYIPMYGRHVYTVKKSVLQEALINGYLELDAVEMLRALAKVEIIDGIDKPDDNPDAYPRIENVTLNPGFTRNGLLQPAAQGADMQVLQTRLPSPLVTAAQSWSMTKYTGDKAIADDADGNDVTRNVNYWRIYIPEQNLSAGNPVTFNVTISNEAAGTSPYTISMASDEFQEDYQNKVLRNHIYRIVVKGVRANGSLNYTLCPRETFNVTIPTFD